MEKKRKIRTGLVVSHKMDKTAVVAVETYRLNTLYKKKVKHTVRYKAHDETNTCQVGDRVSIMETRPLSREKKWRVAMVIGKKAMPGVEITGELPPEVSGAKK